MAAEKSLPGLEPKRKVIEIPNKNLFRTDEVAELLDITRQTVYNLINSGRLECIRPSQRTTRITREELVRISAVLDPDL